MVPPTSRSRTLFAGLVCRRVGSSRSTCLGQGGSFRGNEGSVGSTAFSSVTGSCTGRSPWTVSFGSLDLESGPEAVAVVERLLALADTNTVLLPALTGSEGLFPPGHDSIGPLQDELDTTTSLCGWFFGPGVVETSAFESAAALWDDLADRHPGSARLWLDYAKRSRASLERMG